MSKVWLIHEIESDRYTDYVMIHGIATSVEIRDRISACHPYATVTEIETDRDISKYGADNGC